MKKYSTILVDPPWYQRGGGKSKRGADRHYDLMKEKEIQASLMSILDDRLNDDCHMYMWTVGNHLPEALRILESLGFKYITNIVWAKTRFGLGRYFRGQHELCLFATRGRGFSVRKDNNSVSSLIGGALISPTVHSKKPAEIYELIENRSDGPYLEVYARHQRPGWDVYGREVVSSFNV